MKRFGLGFAPSSGDALLRFLKQKYPEKLLEVSGLISRDQSGRVYDRFRRRIMFPIANESGKVIAFGGRAMGDDMPKYMNSPETPIYSKSNVLYHLDRAKEALRQSDFAVLVEGYMDAIAVARAGIANVVASCGTSLAEPQIKLLGRFTRRVIVNYDPDTAGQVATERSITLAARKRIRRARPRAARRSRSRQIPEGTGRRRLPQTPRAVAALSRLPDRPRAPDGPHHGRRKSCRAEFPDALRAAPPESPAALGMGHPHRFRIARRRARAARSLAPRRRRAPQRSEAESQLLGPAVKPAERQMIHMLVEADGFREKLASELAHDALHRGLESEKILDLLISKVGEHPDPATLPRLSKKKTAACFSRFFSSPSPSLPGTTPKAV